MSGRRRDVVESSNLYALFDCIIDRETGTYLSEDYSFCRRWREIGGEIWIDGKSRVRHCGAYEFVGEYGGREIPGRGEPERCSYGVWPSLVPHR
jgi:hypothetical protein